MLLVSEGVADQTDLGGCEEGLPWGIAEAHSLIEALCLLWSWEALLSIQ